MKLIAHRMTTNAMVRGAFYVVFLSFFVLPATEGFAGIPLITDDTGTMGRGKFQLEAYGEYGHDRDERITANTSDFSATVTYGIIDPVDIILNVPYQFWGSEDSGSKKKGDGISDPGVEVKWRFYEKEGASFALKPGVTLPAGDEQKGLGTGRVTYHLFLIASKEIEPWAIHVNLGYIRNENKTNARKNLWHASLASTFEVVKRLKLVGDVGLETNLDRPSSTPPAYILGGLIYSVSENVDIGFGIKGGLTRPEKDLAARGGITWGF